MLNRVILMGRLTNNPEIKIINEENLKASFVIAVPRIYKNNGEKEVDFIKIIAWNRNAKFVEQYISKGKAIIVEGEIHIDKYEDKDGKKTNHHYVLASQFYFCENKKPNSDEKEDGDDISFLLD